jgi:protein TonB
MFESTLEAQGLNDGPRRLGSMSVAVFAHLGIIAAIVGVTAIIVPPVKLPEPARLIFIPIRPDIPLPVVTEPTPKRPASGPKKSGAGEHRELARTPPVVPPRLTPDELPPVSQEPPTDFGPGPESGGTGGPAGPGGPSEGGDGSGTGNGDGNGDGPQYITAAIDKPVLVSKVEPDYPFAARRIGLGGRVTVSAVIGLDGSVESAEILGSSNSLFDQAALDAVRKWRYRPATMNGQPVRVFFTVRVDFVVR